MLRTRLNLTTTVEASNAQLHEPMELPTTRRECNLRLRHARREVSEIVSSSFRRRDKERKARIQELEYLGGTKDVQQARILQRIQRAEAIKADMKTI